MVDEDEIPSPTTLKASDILHRRAELGCRLERLVVFGSGDISRDDLESCAKWVDVVFESEDRISPSNIEWGQRNIWNL